jgi:hypothetical protein
LLALFVRAPGPVFDCFLRVDSLRIAELLETKYATLTVEWFDRFPETAAARLLPTALTGNAKDSVRAVKAIASLIARGHEAVVFDRAKALGEDAVTELRALLAPPPLPPKPPVLPSLFDATTLPVPKLRGTGEPLGPEHVERLGQLLALLPLGAARAAILEVKQGCDPTSLADFARALVDRWIAAEAPTKEKWVVLGAALVGDDLVAHQLAERIAEWAASGFHARAAVGVEALATLGSDVALMHLDRFAEKSKAKGLKKKSREALATFREEHELSEDDLADRLVPDLGLDASGKLLVSYGPRAFRIVFDGSLRAMLTTEDGSPLRSLPRVAPTDDAQLAGRAQATWQAIKTESKKIAEAQVRRLDRAMASHRRWSHEAFDERLRRHPLMQYFARSIVWGAFDSRGALLATFRIAEDGSLASVDDDAIELPPRSVLGIVHPLALGSELVGRWSTVLADYAIVQPFPQLGRETYVLSDQEKQATTLDRFEDVRVEGGRFFSLKYRGWEFVDVQATKPLAKGRVARLVLSPGIYYLAAKPEGQTLGELALHGEEGPLAFAALDAIEVSELLRDIEMLRR